MKVNRLREMLDSSHTDLQVRVEISPGEFRTVTGVVWDEKHGVVLKLYQRR